VIFPAAPLVGLSPFLALAGLTHACRFADNGPSVTKEGLFPNDQ